MSPGKVAAQCSHATLGAYRQSAEADPISLNTWQVSGEAVIVLGVDSEEQMRELVEKGKDAGLQTHVVRDAGRTEVAPSTATVAAIGPALTSKIDAVTGHLALL
jgi:peptidyl-tRNA hydrolase